MDEQNQTQRGLKARHLSMIAIGGSIGTGLFVASGGAISQAGPGGALIAYGLIGFMVFFLMTSLGEMATYMPVSGSFSTYANKFVDPALGFALGWNYWFNWAITLAVDISTTAIIMQYWFPNIPGWIFSIAFLALIFALNLLSVGVFGEAEFWFSLIKVVTVICFICVGLLTIFGIFGGHFIGMRNFTTGKAPVVGGVPAILGAFVVAGFSFQGVEMVGVTAGESENPQESIPQAIKQIFWRILIFYILAIFVIGMIIPYKSPNLLGKDVSDVTISPFTLVFQRAGLAAAASLMNAVILTSVLSAVNSGLYAGTRMLYAMGCNGQAPKCFAKTTKKGVPLAALVLTSAVGGLAFLTSIFGKDIYTLLVAASGLTGFIAWLGIAVCHLRFRKAFVKQGYSLDELPYQAKWFPIGPILAFSLCAAVILGQGVPDLLHGHFENVLITYMSIPLFIGLFMYYKIKHKTKLIPLDEVDLSSEE